MFRIRGSQLRCQVLLGLSVFVATACAPSTSIDAEFVATIPPLKLILQEIAGHETVIACILPPGASPHTFELRPSTARTLERAKAVFYVDESIDGWAARLAPGRLHAVFSMVPESLRREYDTSEHGHSHSHGQGEHGAANVNAHFWSDPVAVRAIVPELVSKLSQADPDGAARYRANAEAFLAELDALDREFQGAQPPREGYALVAFHPSWTYFFDRYQIAIAAYVEPFPGKEPTPQTIQALTEKLARADRRVVLSEVQLPAKSAEVLAESLGANLAVIDPLGGLEGRDTYAALLRYNAARVREALQ